MVFLILLFLLTHYAKYSSALALLHRGHKDCTTSSNGYQKIRPNNSKASSQTRRKSKSQNLCSCCFRLQSECSRFSTSYIVPTACFLDPSTPFRSTFQLLEFVEVNQIFFVQIFKTMVLNKFFHKNFSMYLRLKSFLFF